MPRKLLALGDSVVWGQGLKDPNKFVEKVRASLGADTELASLARSGAVIDLQARTAQDHTSLLFGELPRSLPGILSQLEIADGNAAFASYLDPHGFDPDFWDRTKQTLRQRIAGYGSAPPDFVLLDGGINDLRAMQIVLPWNLHDGDGDAARTAGPSNVERVVAALDEAQEERLGRRAGPDAVPEDGAAARVAGLALPQLDPITDDQFRALIDKFVFERMRLLLRTLGSKPRFRNSRVIVTGYFPIFTEGSAGSLLALNPALATLLVPSDSRNEQRAALATALAADPREYTNLIIHRSKIWYDFGSQRLSEAVAEANRLFGNRFAFARPAFGPNNGALAPDSFLWSFTGAVDDVLRKILKWLGDRGPGADARAAERGLGGLFGGVDYSVGYGLGAGIATDQATTRRGEAAFDYYLFSGTGRTDPDATFSGGFTTSVASAGHPNPKGVAAYVTAIQEAIRGLPG